MITPTYISFEQAKLLKEKGFKYYCRVSYWDNELTSHTPGFPLENGETSQENYYDFPRFYAPEQHQVVEWLRINHGIWVEIKPECYGDRWFANLNICSREAWDNLYKRNEVLSAFREFNNEHPTPQEAYSAAFDYILNKLI